MNFARPEHVPGKCKPVFRKRHANAQESESTAPRDLTKSGCILAISAAVLVALSASCALAVPALATKNVNMRQGPGTNYPIVTTIPGGSTVDVTGCQGNGAPSSGRGRPATRLRRASIRAPVTPARRPALPVRHKVLKVRPDPRGHPRLVGPCRRARYRRNRRRSAAIRHRRPARSPKALSAPRRRERRRPVIRRRPPAIIRRRAIILMVPITAPTAITGPIGVGRGGSSCGRGKMGHRWTRGCCQSRAKKLSAFARVGNRPSSQ
jgi:hypothetical protein